MFDHNRIQAPNKESFYEQLFDMARGITHGESDRIANAANLSALIFSQVDDLNWAGFYFYDGEELVVGPFQGLPACIRIQLGRGVCGTAAQSGETQIVDDVDAFPGHIPCDGASRSELVVPLFKGEQLIGVLDLDSPTTARFDAEDARGMERIAALYLDSLAN